MGRGVGVVSRGGAEDEAVIVSALGALRNKNTVSSEKEDRDKKYCHEVHVGQKTYPSEVGFWRGALLPGFFANLVLLAARSAALVSEALDPERFRVETRPFPAAGCAPESSDIEDSG